MVGKTVKVDLNTQLAARGKFARVAVEIDLNKPLVSRFTLDGEIQRIEYEGLPQVCFHCGRVGHSILFCPNKNTQADSGANTHMVTETPGEKTAVQRDVATTSYGPWIHAQNRQRK